MLKSNMCCPFCKNTTFVRVKPSNPNHAFMLHEVDIQNSTVHPELGTAIDIEECTNCHSYFFHAHIDMNNPL